MASKGSCKYCNFIQGNSSLVYDSVIDETENFVVVPTLGSLLPGWQLICPKTHYLNTTMLNQNEKLEFNNLLAQRIKATFDLYQKQVVVFEHGAVVDNSLVGCGIDHAHVHILPVDFDFLEAVKSNEVSFSSLELDNISDFYLNNTIDDKPYWICSVVGEEVLFSSDMEATSQFFRKIIAKELNKEGNFDYKEFSYVENAVKTISDFSNLSVKLAV
ncbi:hypothetical protein N9Y67_00565 [Pseudomonadota bacterium]|nr:hypothetical protein [Pseudomonadota bacterium]